MRFSQLKLGRSVEITVIRNEYKLRLVSKIEDVAEDHVSVTLIAANGKRFVFLEEDQIQLVYREEDRLWRWKDLKGVLSVVEGTAVHSFYGFSEGESFNRRNAYRVYLGLENEFSYTKPRGTDVICQDTEEDTEEETQVVKKGCSCIIKDLSENGAAILTNEPLDRNDIVCFALQTEVGPIHCVGKVIRGSSEATVPYSNFYGIQFMKASNAITKYIFTVQRMNLKKARR